MDTATTGSTFDISNLDRLGKSEVPAWIDVLAKPGTGGHCQQGGGKRQASRLREVLGSWPTDGAKRRAVEERGCCAAVWHWGPRLRCGCRLRLPQPRVSRARGCAGPACPAPYRSQALLGEGSAGGGEGYQGSVVWAQWAAGCSRGPWLREEAVPDSGSVFLPQVELVQLVIDGVNYLIDCERRLERGQEIRIPSPVPQFRH